MVINPTAVRFLGIFLFLSMLHPVRAREFTNFTASNPVQLCPIATPPAGILPENIYLPGDFYWILKTRPSHQPAPVSLAIAFEGLPGEINEQKLMVLTRIDSQQAWSVIRHDSIATGKSLSDGAGIIYLKLPDARPLQQFTLASPFSSQVPNQPEGLRASVSFGPVGIDWYTQFEVGADYFRIERKVENLNWEAIATVKATGFGVFQQPYHFEDLSIFTEGTRLAYRIHGCGTQQTPAVSLPIELNYFPDRCHSKFSRALLDTTVNVVLVQFITSLGGKLRIDLFDETPACLSNLVDREIVPGFYACHLALNRFNTKTGSGAAFCRLEIHSPDTEKSFIQIKPLSRGRINY